MRRPNFDSLSPALLEEEVGDSDFIGNPDLEPETAWGVDVGAAAQIRAALLKLRDEGCALLVVSEELDELFEVSDRLVVIAQGRLSPSVPVAEATIETIGEWMSGLWPGAAARPVSPGRSPGRSGGRSTARPSARLAARRTSERASSMSTRAAAKASANYQNGDWDLVDGLPVTTPARTVADLLFTHGDGGHIGTALHTCLSESLVDADELIAVCDRAAPRWNYASGADLFAALLDQAQMPAEPVLVG